MNRALLRETVNNSKAIAWDTCHKIYILMDDNQVQKMKNLGYDAMIQAEHSTPNLMYGTLLNWYKQSCPLKFVYAVSTGSEGDEFDTIVPQN